MMPLPESAADQYRIQQGISTTTAATVSKLWRRMGEDFDASWERVGPQILDVVDKGRRAAVAHAIPYTGNVLAETRQVAEPDGMLSLEAFVDTAPDGRSMDTLLQQSVIRTKTAVGGGLAADMALAQGGRWLTKATLTTLADTRRDVYSADIIQRPAITGYVRMLNPPSCKDCIILGGRWYRWNAGFQRHNNCDCQHIPAAENAAGDVRTDPYATFQAMNPDEQELVFGRSEARAIREGADIYKVVNQSNRKLSTSNSIVDRIYRTAGTRTNAVRMLREQGFILDRGQVVVPRSPGVLSDAEVLARGRGIGTVLINGEQVTTNRAALYDAIESGERDVLRRSTMTAAERRLYDAHYRLDYALRTGTVPRSIGPSSADRFANAIPATPDRIAELRASLQAQVGVLFDSGTPEQVRRLARALGLI